MFASFNFTGRLENRFVTICASMTLSAVVFLILTAQVVLYFWKKPIHTRDPMWIKGVIIFIWILQASEIALSCHMTALSHNQAGQVLEEHEVGTTLWEWGFYIATCAATGFLVHTLFIYRIYLFGRALFNIRISVMLCLVLVLEGSFGFISALSFIKRMPNAPRQVDELWAIPIWLALSILADILISGAFWYILKRSGPTGTGRLTLVVKRLILFFIQTGLITSLVAGGTVAIWAAANLDPGHLLMSFPMGGVYATCLMANFLARGSSYLSPPQMDEESTIVLRESIVFADPESLEKDVQPGSVL